MSTLFGHRSKYNKSSTSNKKKRLHHDVLVPEVVSKLPTTALKEEGEDDQEETKRSLPTNYSKKLKLSVSHDKNYHDKKPSSLSSSRTAEDDSSTTTTTTYYDFESLGLSKTLVNSCRALGFRLPTPIQRAVIPLILKEKKHVLALASTGSGKTAAFVLPMLQVLSEDPYSIMGVIVSPTRELALQIHEQICALGTRAICVRSLLLTGGQDHVQHVCRLENERPHIIVATPGRLAYICRGPNPPRLSNVKFVVLDEADRLLSPVGNFERDIAEILLQTQYIQKPDGTHVKNTKCQTLLFSATMTQSLEQARQLASAGNEDTVPLELVAVDDNGEIVTTMSKKTLAQDQSTLNETNDDTTTPGNNEKELSSQTRILTAAKIPSGLKQEYIFIPSKVRDAYLVTTIRNLMKDYRTKEEDDKIRNSKRHKGAVMNGDDSDSDSDDGDRNNGKIGRNKARSAIIFVPTCEKAARLEALLLELHIDCVSLHGLLTQDRRMASLGKFKSHLSKLLIATDVASRGLDIPQVDLVINFELPRNPEDYIHRVGRTARAGRRGLAISLVGERDISLVHAIEHLTQTKLEQCLYVQDKEAIQYLSSVTKASRLAKIKMAEYGFDELVEQRQKWRQTARNEKWKARKAAAKLSKKSKAQELK